jgi:hypothetical protein
MDERGLVDCSVGVLAIAGRPEGRVFCGFGSAGRLQLAAFECTGLSGARRYPPGLPADNDRSRA